MGDLQMPGVVAWVADVVVGEAFPRGSESGLAALGAAWSAGGRELAVLGSGLGASASVVSQSVGGDVEADFRDFATQLESLVPGMAQAAFELGDLADSTAVRVEYTKAMIIVQTVLVGLQILHFALWAPEEIPAAITGGRVAVRELVKRLAVSVGIGAALNVGSDVLVQVGQFLAGHRHAWDTDATVSAVESGVIGGAVGGVVFGLGGMLRPAFAHSLLGKLALGAVTGGVTEGVSYGIWGGDTSAFGSAVTSGFIGAIEGGSKFRLGRHADGTGPLNALHLRTARLRLPGTGHTTDTTAGLLTTSGTGVLLTGTAEVLGTAGIAGALDDTAGMGRTFDAAGAATGTGHGNSRTGISTGSGVSTGGRGVRDSVGGAREESDAGPGVSAGVAGKARTGLDTLKATTVRTSSAGADASNSNDLYTARNHTTATTTETAAARTATTTTAGAGAVRGRAVSVRGGEQTPDGLVPGRPVTVAAGGHSTAVHGIPAGDSAGDSAAGMAAGVASKNADGPGGLLPGHPGSTARAGLDGVVHRATGPATAGTPSTTAGATGPRPGPATGTAGTITTTAATATVTGTGTGRPGAAAPAPADSTTPPPGSPGPLTHDTRRTSDSPLTADGGLPGFGTDQPAPHAPPPAGPVPDTHRPTSTFTGTGHDELTARSIHSELTRLLRPSPPDPAVLSNTMKTAARTARAAHGDEIADAIHTTAELIAAHGPGYTHHLGTALTRLARLAAETLGNQRNTPTIAARTTDLLLTGHPTRTLGGTPTQHTQNNQNNHAQPHPTTSTTNPHTTHDSNSTDQNNHTNSPANPVTEDPYTDLFGDPITPAPSLHLPPLPGTTAFSLPGPAEPHPTPPNPTAPRHPTPINADDYLPPVPSEAATHTLGPELAHRPWNTPPDTGFLPGELPALTPQQTTELHTYLQQHPHITFGQVHDHIRQTMQHPHRVIKKKDGDETHPLSGQPITLTPQQLHTLHRQHPHQQQHAPEPVEPTPQPTPVQNFDYVSIAAKSFRNRPELYARALREWRVAYPRTEKFHKKTVWILRGPNGESIKVPLGQHFIDRKQKDGDPLKISRTEMEALKEIRFPDLDRFDVSGKVEWGAFRDNAYAALDAFVKQHPGDRLNRGTEVWISRPDGQKILVQVGKYFNRIRSGTSLPDEVWENLKKAQYGPREKFANYGTAKGGPVRGSAIRQYRKFDPEEDKYARAVERFFDRYPAAGIVARTKVNDVPRPDGTTETVNLGAYLRYMIGKKGLPPRLYDLLALHSYPRLKEATRGPELSEIYSPAGRPLLRHRDPDGPGTSGGVVSSVVLVRVAGGGREYWRVDHRADGSVGWFRPGSRETLSELPAGVEVLGQAGAAAAGGGVRAALEEDPIPPDGNCFYATLGVLLGEGNSHETAVELRRAVVEWFDRDEGRHVRELAAAFGDLDELRYTIATDGAWAGGGGDLAPYIAANALRATLHIHHATNTTTITPLTHTHDGQPLPPPTRTFHLHLRNNHYTLTTPNPTPPAPTPPAPTPPAATDTSMDTDRPVSGQTPGGPIPSQADPDRMAGFFDPALLADTTAPVLEAGPGGTAWRSGPGDASHSVDEFFDPSLLDTRAAHDDPMDSTAPEHMDVDTGVPAWPFTDRPFTDATQAPFPATWPTNGTALPDPLFDLSFLDNLQNPYLTADPTYHIPLDPQATAFQDTLHGITDSGLRDAMAPGRPVPNHYTNPLEPYLGAGTTDSGIYQEIDAAPGTHAPAPPPPHTTPPHPAPQPTDATTPPGPTTDRNPLNPNIYQVHTPDLAEQLHQALHQARNTTPPNPREITALEKALTHAQTTHTTHHNTHTPNDDGLPDFTTTLHPPHTTPNTPTHNHPNHTSTSTGSVPPNGHTTSAHHDATRDTDTTAPTSPDPYPPLGSAARSGDI
ncbi:hypothetical protein ACGFYV_29140 [Streptomyces sp. NPDC048297]|uniref:WXG100-like domain-containing protein n=1 Tax=Streptomyces sp. NPDC048297 TaxID=3365531 RepID=UPI0037150320